MAEKEYIEREELKQVFAADTQSIRGWDIDLFDLLMLEIDEAPTADVVPVRHGHWIRPEVPNTRSYKWQCSECGQTAYWLHYGNRGNKNIICKYSYCPNCGAKMDGDKNGS